MADTLEANNLVTIHFVDHDGNDASYRCPRGHLAWRYVESLNAEGISVSNEEDAVRGAA